MLVVNNFLALWFALVLAGQGNVATYRPGVMREVAQNRGMTMLWGEVDGFASTRHCERVDTKADPSLRVRPWLALVSINSNKPELFQIVDCSAPKDLRQQARDGVMFEIDAASGRRNGVTERNKNVRVWRIWRP